MSEPWVVVGVGSPHGDDQIGWQVAQGVVQRLGLEEGQLHLLSRPVSQLWSLLHVPRLLIIDACQAGLPAASLRRVTIEQLESQTTGLLSSHGLGVAELLRLANHMAMEVEQIHLYGVQLQQTSPLAELSQSLKDALPHLVDQVVAEIALE